jgi:DNA-binding SARP family transcriptional activator
MGLVATDVRFLVLGPLEMTRAGRPVPLGAAKLRTLLAVLLLRPNQSTSLAHLTERLWGETPPVDPRRAVHTYVARLRAALGPDADLIRTDAEGYLIRVEPHQLDLAEFDALVERAGADPDGEAALLAEALALWRGSALGNVESEFLHRHEAATLNERRLLAVERRLDAELRLGRHAELVGELRQLTTEHPLRERFWAQLMAALYGAGRQSEALEAYRAVTAVLADELGVDPDRELRELHRAILNGEPARPPDSAPPPARAWSAVCQLPPDLPDFVGRHAERERLEEALTGRAGVPLLVVSGLPGIGKTALAVTVAHRLRPRFPDGQWYVRLAGAGGHPRDPAEVLADLLGSAGMHPAAIPEGLERRAATLRARVADRRVLLVLDDAAGAAQVRPLLPGTAGSAVLVTSRQQLGGLVGGTVLRLDPFGRDDTSALLAAVVGADRVAREPTAADALSAACAGLPLALRIAAARLVARPNWTVLRMADRLADERRRLDELAVDDLAVRASLRLSYDLLGPDAQAAFRLAGLLGGLDLAAWCVSALVGRPDGEPLLDQLVDASLLAPAGTDPGGEPRYRMHDIVSLYARELAHRDEPAVTEAALRRYHQALLAVVDACARQLPPVLEDLRPLPYPVGSVLADAEVRRLAADPLPRLLTEHTHIRQAIERTCELGDAAVAAALAERALRQVETRVGPQLAERLYAQVRDAAAAGGDDRTALRAEYHRGVRVLIRGRLDEAYEALTACAEGFDRMGLPVERARSLAELAFCRSEQGDQEAALALATRATTLADEHGEPADCACALLQLGFALARSERYPAARAALDRALATAGGLGAPRTTAFILMTVAATARRDGDLPEAHRAAERAAGIFRGQGDAYGEGWSLLNLAMVANADGRPAAALRHCDAATVLLAEVGDLRGQNVTVVHRAMAQLALGRPAEVLRILPAAIEELDRLGVGLDGELAHGVLAEAQRLTAAPRG